MLFSRLTLEEQPNGVEMVVPLKHVSAISGSSSRSSGSGSDSSSLFETVPQGRPTDYDHFTCCEIDVCRYVCLLGVLVSLSVCFAWNYGPMHT